MKRFARMLVLVLGLCLITKLSLALDPLEVAGPENYKLDFENERVRVMEVFFKPGDKIATHSHPDHFVYVLEGGKLVLSYPDGTTKDFEGKAGDVVWIPAETHAAENVGSTQFRGLVVELKESKSQMAEMPNVAEMPPAPPAEK